MLFTVLLVKPAFHRFAQKRYTPHNSDLSALLQAYRYLEEMQKRIPPINLSCYVTQQTIEAVHRGVGIPISRTLVPEQIRHSSMENKEVEEEVADEVEDP